MATRRNRRSVTTRPVSARTAKRRAAKVQRERETANHGGRQEPETMAQARAFDRKKKRYRRLGLCHPCAAQAALGHQLGFAEGRIHDPCQACAPIVASFPDDGPRGSKWRKCLIKVENMTRTEARELGLV
jgi:hypothetical protein